MVDITSNVKTIAAKLVPKSAQTKQSILDLVRNDPRYSQTRSVDWFKKKINEYGGNSPEAKYDLQQKTKQHQFTRFLPGAMYIFKYDPKTKADLPYYDNWPCSLMFSLTDTGMVGINFHYLSYDMRGRLFDQMNAIAIKYHNNQQQVLRLNWKLLSNVSKFPMVRPAVKQYLYSHVRSKLIRIPVEEWKIAMMLPIESFSKKSQAYVARDSGQQIRKVISGG